ncbi:MAG TPA: protein kinase [Pirellulales bacterium]|nr:protein kinase [Pirellulales bacterium]
MNQLSACPDRQTLAHLLDPHTKEEQAVALEEHLLACDRCCEALREIETTDTVLEAARGATARLPTDDEVQRVISRLKLAQVPSAAINETLASKHEATEDAWDLEKLLDPPEGEGELGRFGGYRVLRVLGAGGMGLVFDAEDPKLRRRVALKVMKRSLAARDEHRQRFLREARAAAAIEHTHIVTVYQVGEHGGLPFMAMQLLKGESLDDRLRREPRLPLDECLRIGRETAEALAEAHQRNLIHRDIKPANIWLEGASGWVKLVDFGLAHAAEDVHLTQTGAILGTPAYMSPEQARGEAVDGRTDLYSLGAVLYKLTTGNIPFGGASTMAVLMALATETPRRPRELNPDLPPALDDLLMRLLAKKPDERFTSANEVAEAIRAIEQEHLKPKVQSPKLGSHAGRRGPRWPFILAAAAAAFILAAIVIIVRDKDGKEVARVSVDGASAKVRTDAAASNVDPALRDGNAGRLPDGQPTSPPRSVGAALPEPPPLEDWLQGRTVLTVAQDGSGQFKTIQAALDALKPHQVVKVLDGGPYREFIRTGGLPEDVGLISARQTVIETSDWQAPDGMQWAHSFGPLSGFRLSGFRFVAPASRPPQSYYAIVHWNAPSGSVVEDCCFANTAVYPRVTVAAMSLPLTPTDPAYGPVVVRHCLFDAAALNTEGDSSSLLVERNYFRESVMSLHGRFDEVVIRHNIFGGEIGEFFLEGLNEVDRVLEISNNTVSQGVSLVNGAPVRGVVLLNNITGRDVGFDGEAYKLRADVAKQWRRDHNSYLRRPLLAKSPTDVMEDPAFLSTDPAHRDYWRVPSDGPLAHGGAGGKWPTYIGALPPGPAPKEGDWFTRLRERWRNGAGGSQPKETLDVLSLLDLAQDRVSIENLTGGNNWRLAGGTLTYTTDAHSGKMVAPIDLKQAQDYEFVVDVRRLSGASVFTLDFPASEKLGTGIDIYIGGVIELKLENGARHKIGAWPAAFQGGGTVVARIRHETSKRPGSVDVLVNGTPAAHWQGDVARIGNPLESHPRFPRRMTLGLFCFQDSFEFRSWQLRVFEGHAEPLRPVASQASTATESLPSHPSRNIPPPKDIQEPPSLEEWLKDRTVLTVAQDGSGQFLTIQEALNALKPHQVVKVFDRGPYREMLRTGGLPDDTGLIGAQQAVIELPSWLDGNGEQISIWAQEVGPGDGFRLNGLRFLAPRRGAELGWGVVFRAKNISGLVVEDCHFGWIAPPDMSQAHGCLEILMEDGQVDDSAVVVRNCMFDCGAILISPLPDGQWNGTLLAEHNYFRSGFVSFTKGRLHQALIRHNVFGKFDDATLRPSAIGSWGLNEIGSSIEIANNTAFTGGLMIDGAPPPRGFVIRNNITTTATNLDPVAAKALPEISKNWLQDHNAYTRRGAFAKSPSDVTSDPGFLSRDPAERDYARIPADGPLATGGAGGDWPDYIGALPPGPAPQEGDWFTRVRERWLKVGPALGDGVASPSPRGDGSSSPRSVGATLPEPPPLEDWLKGRTVLTVAQDGSGQFETIQAALNALRPGQVVKVLDRGPYREAIRTGGLPEDTGLIGAQQAVIELPGWLDGNGADIYMAHALGPGKGFRLSGLRFLTPPRKEWGVVIQTDNVSGLVVEDCCFGWTAPREPNRTLSNLTMLMQDGQVDDAPVVVRNCVFDCGSIELQALPDGQWSGTLLVEHNCFRSGYVAFGKRRFHQALIRHNVFDKFDVATTRPGAIWFDGLSEIGSSVEIANNTVLTGGFSVNGAPPTRGFVIRNNLTLTGTMLDGIAGKSLLEIAKNWRQDHNGYTRLGSFAKSPTDLTADPGFLSRDPADRDYARIPADGPLATGGAGGDWPAFIGALPPGPAPKEGDWFTRLQERWRGVDQKTTPSKAADIPSPAEQR